MNEEKDRYEEKVEARISQVEARIHQMRAKADEAKAEAKIEYLNQLEKLEESREELRKRFDELRDAGENAWVQFRSGVDEALESLEKALS